MLGEAVKILTPPCLEALQPANHFFLFFQPSARAAVSSADLSILRMEAGRRRLSLWPSLPWRSWGLC